MAMTMPTSRHTWNINLLPDHVNLDIFSRLSIKTLKRLSCVSKSWYSAFQGSNFIRSYNRNDTVHRNLLLFTYTKVYSGHDYYHVLHIYSLCSETMKVSNWRFPLNLSSEPTTCECEGLICLSDLVDDHVFLLNPETRDFKRLRPSHMNRPSSTIEYCIIATGLGYDSITSDYKMVRVIRNQGEHKAEVYSLSKDCWKEISCPLNTGRVIIVANKSTYLNGHCYWWVEEKESKMFRSKTNKRYILTFDMSQETFQTIAFPACCSKLTPLGNASDKGLFPTLRVFNNRLAFFQESIVTESDIEYSCIEIWVMKDYNNCESWFRETIIEPSYEIIDEYGIESGMWTGGEWLLRSQHDGSSLKLYDPNTDKDIWSEDVRDTTPWDDFQLLEVLIAKKNLLPLFARRN